MLKNVHHSSHASDCTMLERPPVLQVPVEVIAAEVRNEVDGPLRGFGPF